MDQEKVIVIDFGGQYNQLVARRVRECNVYCEIYSYKTDLAQIKAMNPKGIILTGGPNSCYEDGAPTCTKELFELGVPVLGLCYGAQLMQHVLGGKVEKAPVREYGKTETFVDKSSALFSDVSEKTIVWMSHFDYISQVAPGFKIVAHTADCPVAAAECTEKNLYAIQFHPEVLHTQEGTKMLHNFVRGIYSSLCEEVNCTNLLGFFLKYTDKLFSDNLSLSFWLSNACKLRVISFLCINSYKVKVKLSFWSKYALNLIAFIFTEKTVVYEYACKLLSNSS